MSQGAGAGATRSRGRRNSEQGPHLWGCDSGAGQGASPAALARLRGQIPEGTLFRPRRAHFWGCDSGAGRGTSPAGPCASPGSHPMGSPVPPSDAPALARGCDQGDRAQAPARDAVRCSAVATGGGIAPEGTVVQLQAEAPQ